MTLENLGESVVKIPAPRVLCVDDDREVLLALRRILCRVFSVDAALSAEEGLTLLSKQRYAVVITDLAMPMMDGIEFLSKARDLAPDVTRLLLTGRSDFGDAVEATNTGHVFRFLAKPYQIDELLATVADAVDHHRRVIAERGVLQETFAGVLPALTELACILNRGVAARMQRTRQASQRLANAASLVDAWELEATGLITLLACQTSPTARWLFELGLADTEHRLLERAVLLARQMYHALPRFREISSILEAAASDGAQTDTKLLVARLLVRWQILDEANLDAGAVWQQLSASASTIPESWVEALQSLDDRIYQTHESPVAVDELQPGMVMATDVIAQGSQRHVLLQKGAELTRPVLERIRNYARSPGIVEPLLVAERIRVDVFDVRPEPAVRQALAVGGAVSDSDLSDAAVSGTWRTK